ncbi:aspartic proteinase CDR1 [Cajanus cajan]|uniref:Aspartic proteinase nepenthesin-2 n=1 Tax=Cajanus cajan TaxID=3821 RepID=A0A151T9L4_CAJCA|nr:aspartic proteinase CDR1 [Cajanus cajan]KYP63738.1 Aspartic proteinase nepenthesin-2 [Cajanus cajan]
MHPFVFFSLALCSLSIASFAEATKTLRGFSVDLIHRDSPLSPFYNPSLTPSERIRNAALRSISRFNRVAHTLDENKSPETILIPENGEHLVRFHIGTPPVERLAIADTGSNLIWVQCSPCANCFPQDTPLFEPLKSSTFNALSCGSQPCLYFPPHQRLCGNAGECIYGYGYLEKSITGGLLGTETINLGSKVENQTVNFPNSVFGCGLYNNLSFPTSDKVTGLVGLGPGPLSLVSQIGDKIGYKFSYCLLPFTSNSTSKLRFGSEATITGNGVVSTPLIINPNFPTFYFLNLESITIGQKVLQTGQTVGNVIIDSGTMLTYIDQTFYPNFVASLQEALSVEATQDLPFPFNFCFPYRKILAFPDIAFQFTGARVSLNPKNLLFRVEYRNMLCLAVVPSNLSGISIFGSIAQIDFQVEYDLQGKKVSFAPADCTKI